MLFVCSMLPQGVIFSSLFTGDCRSYKFLRMLCSPVFFYVCIDIKVNIYLSIIVIVCIASAHDLSYLGANNINLIDMISSQIGTLKGKAMESDLYDLSYIHLSYSWFWAKYIGEKSS